MTTAELIEATLPRLRDRAGWYAGDQRARNVLAEILNGNRNQIENMNTKTEYRPDHKTWRPCRKEIK